MLDICKLLLVVEWNQSTDSFLETRRCFSEQQKLQTEIEVVTYHYVFCIHKSRYHQLYIFTKAVVSLCIFYNYFLVFHSSFDRVIRLHVLWESILFVFLHKLHERDTKEALEPDVTPGGLASHSVFTAQTHETRTSDHKVMVRLAADNSRHHGKVTCLYLFIFDIWTLSWRGRK